MSIPIPQEPHERGAARATASDNASADQQARYLTLHVGALVGIVVLFVVKLVLGLAALLQQLGYERPAHAAPAQYAAGYQEAQELAIPIAAFLSDVLVVLIHVNVIIQLILRLAARSDEARDQCATDAAPSEHAAADDEAQDLAILPSRFLSNVLVVLVRIHIIVRPAAVLDETREEEPAQPPTPQHAAGEERAHELTVVIAAFVARVLVPLLVRAFRPLTQKSSDEGAPDSAVLKHATADREFREILGFPCTGAHVVILWLSVA
jgi:hypothetical protein